MWKYLGFKPAFTIKIRFLLLFVIFLLLVIFDGGRIYYRIFYVVITAMIVASFIVIINCYGVAAKVKLNKSKYTTGNKVDYSIILYNNSVIPAAFVNIRSNVFKYTAKNCKDDIISLGPAARKALDYEIKIDRRGVYNLGNIEIKMQDIAQIASSIKKIKQNTLISVYPKVFKIKLSKLTILSNVDNLKVNSSGIEDPYMVRENRKYAAGDSLKRINWKISARNNELYVKNEDHVSGHDFNVFIDMNKNNYINGYEDEENLVNMCVSIVSEFNKKSVATKIFINNKENKVMLVKDKKDFSRLMDYFLYNKSESKIDFETYIKANFNEEAHVYNAAFITDVLTKNLLDYAKELVNIRKKNIIIFYNSIYAIELEKALEQRLKKCGIELIKIQQVIN
ncbi:DUF58 domain-containing protein [Clostridium oryzae]|uniref:DUF58 domain-containing protein n=1 Tax=Clostridium oryzae TaxID=1450648 RepID=A0A1V4IH99_9CLOT|nr:DUF58 domain-containing protein [Clostridium oryzae]OPJ59381.1 hypothetical protein CLORY_33090 [Clostridium oryzae]